MLDNTKRLCYTRADMRYAVTLICSLMFAVNALADTVTDLRPAICEAAAAYGVDPVMMEAIIRHESAHATSHAARNKNNLAGIMGRSGQRRYETKEECVQDLARILANYKAKGRVTLVQISRTYCASGGEWVRLVSHNMRAIRSGKWGAVPYAAEEESKG